MSYIATIQLLSDSLPDIANELRILADQIEKGNFLESVDPEIVVHVRQFNTQGGEEPLDAGRYWAVGHNEASPGAVIAIFGDEEHAIRFANGEPIFDDESLPSDLGVFRARVVGTFWNSYDRDPDGE